MLKSEAAGIESRARQKVVNVNNYKQKGSEIFSRKTTPVTAPAGKSPSL